MEDFELIAQLKKGDGEAFRQLVDHYQKLVLNSCYKFVYNRETAEDLTQDVFIEVYRSINTFRADSKLSTWIYRISISKSLDYLKGQKRKKRFAILKSLFGEDEVEERISAPESVGPDKVLENEDRVKVLAWALNKLPESQRIAFTLSKYDEMSYQEISEILGVSISSVESLIHRAKLNLKKKLYSYYQKHL
ncbi:MAG: RNA polymerase sigma factor [Ignavibacteriales bacterium]|nr:RNA polymerase sigma factor [Ignavibacteriales bacterium]OGU63933.1 MAG: RNA polymerase subunit sigma-24 [Stygiobacter sp. GWC2_38_9]OGU82261.1 MAG: RNA polymerase subunit sigma-24 [Stygiobacter sp. RIFOXYA12_FULL_38_9]OGV08357.1 MAG: RNA polymerase subunit sigma-24 [Stygiobacter sp. RIFOXYB2_FULL_37_11]OGV13130.1 MAG: RNA polymerase subunit sigma-24 [Stygiobacter sp. RIFOXYC2_FULL_38_25]OGV17042.1 MAG: RNA polymerase subunit sigma-24 [Stygiobacter sp. RIFOXYA2_FULL_38_8]OGV23078.1 MAG: RN